VAVERGDATGDHGRHVATSQSADTQGQAKTTTRSHETRAFSWRDAGIRDLNTSSSPLDARPESSIARTGDRQPDVTPDVTLQQAMRDLRSRLLVSHPPAMSPCEKYTSPTGESRFRPASPDAAVLTSTAAAVSLVLPRISTPTPVSRSRANDDASGDVDRRLSRTTPANHADYRSDQLVIEKLDIRIAPPAHEPSRREPVRPAAPSRQAGAWSTAARHYISRV
jgi:hypothetical protein